MRKPLSPLLRPHAATLLRETPNLPLHSVAQLLLTAGQAARPASFDHALQAMALNGALTLVHGGSTPELRLAMLCGLLHDLGEMYIAPEHGEADAERTFTFQSYKHLVVHPHVGKLLLQQLTNYPAVVARAVGEHHERLDGSGYPLCQHGEQLSPQGRQLAVTEAVLAVLRGECPLLARASVALRVVPGEFDLGWVGAIAHASRQEPPLQASMSADEIRVRLALLDAALQTAHVGIVALASTAQSQALMDALGMAEKAGPAAQGMECERPVDRRRPGRARRGRGGSGGAGTAVSPARHPQRHLVARRKAAGGRPAKLEAAGRTARQLTIQGGAWQGVGRGLDTTHFSPCRARP